MSDAAAGESAGGTARRWRLRLTRAGLLWLAATLILGLVVWFKNLNLLVFLAYLMLVLLVLNGVLAWLQVRRTAVTRLPLSPVHAGERVHRRVRVRNAGQRPATVSIIERGEQTLEWFLSRLPAGGDVECMEWAVFLRRGRFGRQPPVIASEFPRGLVRCERDGEPGDEIIVLPAVGALDAPSLKRWLVLQGGS
jgi:uncharacterized protein (DUF58 family)